MKTGRWVTAPTPIPSSAKSIRYEVRAALLAALITACGGDADSVGIGATCQQTSDCGDEMRCLTAYAGGLCAKVGCSAHGDCPEPGLCVLMGDEPLA